MGVDLDHILQKLYQPPQDMREIPGRVELCRRALTLVSRNEDSARWAWLQATLAGNLAQNPLGPRADNLEEAIACYQQALQVYTRQSYPEQWAGTQFNLAVTYGDRMRSERADNLEQAIVHYGKALEVYTKQSHPEQWAGAQNNLAYAYHERIRGERANNLERSIEHDGQALQVYTRKAYPEQWAGVQNGLGIAYSERIHGERADNLERAFAHYKQALEVYTRQAFPEKWAWTQNNLANVYKDRIRGERAENLEQAIAHCKQALKVRTRQAFPEQWAETKYNLANAYLHRIRGEAADNLEQAIDHIKQALEVYTRQAYPEQWAQTQNILGNAYLNRIRGQSLVNFEQAITYFKQALDVRTRQSYPTAWAMTQNNLGNAYRGRISGERAENLEQAIYHYKQALEVRTRQADPMDWAQTQKNLGSAYNARVRGERADNLKQAIVHYGKALKVYTKQSYPEQWAGVQNNLASAYRDRISGERANNLEKAITHHKHALEVSTRQSYPIDWAETQSKLGFAYMDRIRGKRADNLAQAINHFEAALKILKITQLPAAFQRTQHGLGFAHFGKKQWAASLAAYQEVIRAEKVLMAAAYTEAARWAATAQTSGVYSYAAYALLKLERAGEALAQLEQGKTRLLSRALALSEVDLSFLPAEHQKTLQSLRLNLRELEAEMRLPPDYPARRDDRTLAESLEETRERLNDTIATVRQTHPDFMREGLSLPEILALIPKDAVLVAPLITSEGSAVFVLPAETRTVGPEHLLWLDDFGEAELLTFLQGHIKQTQQLGGWLGAYFNSRSNTKEWLDAIEITGQAMWDHFMGPIAERLTNLHARHVLLMMEGRLGLLPVHAAWHEVEGGRRYFLDDHPVSYVTSSYARRVSLDRLPEAKRQARTLLAIVNPTKDLQFTPAEGELIAGLFGIENSTVLSDNKATPKAVEQKFASYLHFACHGFYDWRDPMQSGLILAKGEPLTLAQIIGQFNLESTRLVTLSACETGIADIRQSPDEYLGLPAGFQQAGAPSVISTLWPVNDLSTMLLMERFYQLHLQVGEDVPEALRQAQIWLRDVTAGELAKRFAEEEDAALFGSARMPLATASEAFTRFASPNPEHRPFAHPYYWAAFTFSGA